MARISIPLVLVLAWMSQISALRLQEKKSQNLGWEITPEHKPIHTAEAIENVKKGTGSVWLFHTTHHAGTALKGILEANGLKRLEGSGECSIAQSTLEQNPGSMIDACGEGGITDVAVGDFGKKFSRDSDKLLAVYPVRHPIHRSLAGDGMFNWDTKPDGCQTDNYGLRKLIGLDFRTEITKDHIKAAKERAASFDIVVDTTNFTQTLHVLCGSLGFECTNKYPEKDQEHQDKVNAFQKEHPDIHKRWLERNQPEMELYEFALELVEKELANLPEPSANPSNAAFAKKPKHTKIDFDKLDSKEKWVCPGELVAK